MVRTDLILALSRMRPKTSLQIWSVEQSATASGPVSHRDVLSGDIELWLANTIGGNLSPGFSWKTELLLLHSHEEQSGTCISAAKAVLDCLVGADGYMSSGVFTTSDTVELNLHPAEQRSDIASDMPPAERLYSVSDNVFGVCWLWDPVNRHTRGFIHGCGGEGARQMQTILQSLPVCYQLRANPLLVGLLTLEAEVVEMQRWLSAQSMRLTEAQVQTGHHSYANVVRQADSNALDLANMSRDVCGLAVNVSTSTLCLQRIVKLADFIQDDFDSMTKSWETSPASHQSYVECLLPGKTHFVSRTQAWRRRADSLLDEAQCWKYKASILVQTVFTLATQRDQDISIEIARDSKTLAQKATQDSSSMKIIAAVTMCFLPGTFVAVRSKSICSKANMRLYTDQERSLFSPCQCSIGAPPRVRS